MVPVCGPHPQGRPVYFSRTDMEEGPGGIWDGLRPVLGSQRSQVLKPKIAALGQASHKTDRCSRNDYKERGTLRTGADDSLVSVTAKPSDILRGWGHGW